MRRAPKTPQAIGVFTNDPNGVFQRNVIRGVEQEAKQHDYPIEVIAVPDWQNTAPRYDSLAGIISVEKAVPDNFLRMFYRLAKPLSLIAHIIPDTPVPTVISNNAQGIAELVRYLCDERGCSRFVYIRGIAAQIDAQQRERAFREELTRRGFSPQDARFVAGDFDPPIAAQSIRALVKQRKEFPFDAILAADYMMGIAAAEVLYKANIDIPDEVAIAGFGDGHEALDADLTTVAANVSELGVCATRQVVKQIDGLRISGATVLSTRLIVRGT
ncbi:MAG TPA: substrate-binding domain-containing protein [Aggregatilineales bacterium]|nr:substrate-binding domain-containing protein [Aggregatilineales bacterium]